MNAVRKVEDEDEKRKEEKNGSYRHAAHVIRVVRVPEEDNKDN